MEHYLVSARKYRPSTFRSVVGQSALTATLKNAIQTGRLAHSYLFCGSRGVGKTSCARIFAKTINCENLTAEGEACNECDSCRAFNSGASLNIIELDAASNNGVDAIRQLVEQVNIPPVTGRYRVFIVDEVHMLSPSAFNAFLKTLEEPPAYVVFILATTEKNKIIPTILSRCQIYDFSRITVGDIASHLAYVAASEGMTAEPQALNVIARKADGALRDALSIFDQVAACTRGNITYSATIENLNVLDAGVYTALLEKALAGDITATWLLFKQVRDRGFDAHFFINGLGSYLRDLMAARMPGTRQLLDCDDDEYESLRAMAGKCSPKFLYKAMTLCNDADLNYRDSGNKQFLVEVTLARICQLLSPSPDEQDNGEGQLKPIPRPESRPESAATGTPAAGQTPVRPAQPVAQPRQAAPSPRQAVSSVQQPSAARRSRQQPPAAGARISLKGNGSGDSRTADTVQPGAGHRSTAFSSEDLSREWLAFAQANHADIVLATTMRDARPQLSADGRISVNVPSGVAFTRVNDYAAAITAHLRDALSNDSITLSLTPVDDTESRPKAWTEREVFARMMETHPALHTLVEQFKLTLE